MLYTLIVQAGAITHTHVAKKALLRSGIRNNLSSNTNSALATTKANKAKNKQTQKHL